MEIMLANPRGFCAGVDRAIDIVERALVMVGAPVYVRHEVVHNRYVVDRLREQGAVFVDELSEVPDDVIVVFSAHGVSRAVVDEADARGLRVFDATCPLVTKVHMEVLRYAREGRDVILIGHAGHPEVEGTMGRFDAAHGGHIYLVEAPDDVKTLTLRDPENTAFVTQTTLSMDDTAQVINALRERYPAIKSPRRDDICYATQNRQDAVKKLAMKVPVLLVVGSKTSSNSNRLVELGKSQGAQAHLVDGPEDMRREWFADADAVGVTAGASAPEILVEQVVDQLRDWGGHDAREVQGQAETITFSLPRELRNIKVETTVQSHHG